MIKDLHSFVRIEVPRAEIFPHFFAYNLLKVFEKLWYVPKFLSPTFKNNFSKPGTGNYIIYFDDNNTARYQLLTFLQDISFSTQINDLTSFRFIGLELVECHFSFSDLETGKTNIQFECLLKLSSRFWGSLFEILARKTVQRHLDTFLIQIAKEYEQFWLLKRRDTLVQNIQHKKSFVTEMIK